MGRQSTVFIAVLSAVCPFLFTGCQTFKMMDGLEVTILSISYHQHEHQHMEAKHADSDMLGDGPGADAGTIETNPFEGE